MANVTVEPMVCMSCRCFKIFSGSRMSGTVQLVFSLNELKEEKVETVIAAEEFQVSEYHEAVSLQGPMFSSSVNRNTCLKSEENPATEGSESAPIFATSLLDPSFMEQEGILSEVKVGEDSSSLFQDPFLLGERRNSNEAQETSKSQ